MQKVKLKVCGITSLPDALAAVEAGAAYLGFNFYQPSPRYLEPAAAWTIIAQLPPGVIGVGVFVNELEPDSVLELMERSGVRYAQLHGDEDAEYCAEVGAARVIKALRVGADFVVHDVLEYPASAILLDAYDKNLYGGTGKTANWELAQKAARLTTVFLAGGLSPDNVAEAVRTVHPFAVDVNSGVESAPGRKDADKLKLLRQALDSIQ
ncbi:MAG: phosphoribosylanthranilate isomerase [Acidobacteria bacterium]|nr:phosphoribosylanthranilate isomerase [Acidobacteriota bacterium]MBI3423569.1 phosphoribosylanthranilate isomerase [Acidobacteriota bacterium]